MPAPSVVANEVNIGDGDIEQHHSLHCTNREIQTTILREFQQLTSHFDHRMLRQDELIKSLFELLSYQSNGIIGPLPMDSLPRETLSSLRPHTWAPDLNYGHNEAAERLPSVTAPSLQPKLLGGQSIASKQRCSIVAGNNDAQSTVEAQAMDYNHKLKRKNTEQSIKDAESYYSRVTTAEQRRKEKSYYSSEERYKNRDSQGSTDSEGPIKWNTLARHPYFEPVFAFAVVLNSVLIGFEVESMAKNPGADTHWIFEVLTNTFALVFLIELMLRLYEERTRFCTKGSFWNYLDAFLVLFSILELCASLAASRTGTGQVGAAIPNLRIVRLLRITKLIRVVRIIKVVRFIRALRKLVYAIASTLRSLLGAMLMLLMTTYMFGIVYTQAAAHYMEDNPDIDEGISTYWSTVPRSVFTLFKTATGGVSWQDPVTPLAEIHWLYVLLFLSYITFMQFAMINVVTGVFCQSAIDSASHDYDLVVQGQLADKEMYHAKIVQLFNTIDVDGSGEVTIGEFENHLMDKKVHAYFEALELDSSDVWTLFKLLDMDESHVLDISEFLLGCLRLRGPAKAIDLAQMAYESKIFRKRLYKFMADVEMVMGVPQPGEKLGTVSMDLHRESRKSHNSRASHAVSPVRSPIGP